MTRKHWIIAFAAITTLAVVLFIWLVRQLTPPVAEQGPLDEQHAAIAARFLDHLDAERFDAARRMLDADAAEALSADKLAEIWTALPKQLGGPATRGAARGERIAGHSITTIPLQFPNMALDARIGLDAEQRIHTFRLVPAQQPRAAAPPPADSGLQEREVSVAGLPGTLTLPAGTGPFPAIVLVHGSGPLDRNETIGPNQPFRDLAHGLAAGRIAVLRYDKRTLARPADFADRMFTVDDETVDDAVAAVAWLRAEPSIDPRRVFLLGHSLGALMAPRIAQRAPDLAGLVLLAAPARPLDEIVLEQIAYIADLDGQRSPEEQQAIDATREAAAALHAALDGDGPAATPSLLGLPIGYWRDLLDYDPVTTAAALPQPMLVLHGGRDYQVTLADFERWRSALAENDGVRLQLYPAMNHLFAAGDGQSSPDEYLRPAAVDAAVIADIGGWIDAQR